MDVDAAPLTRLEAEPKKEKKKKRKSESMEVDEDEEDSHSSKKVKLSKEEKKALKKAMKKQAKAEGGEVRSHLFLQSLVLDIMSRRNLRKRRRRKKRRKRKRKRRRKAKPSQCFSSSRFLAFPVSPCFRSYYLFSYFNSKGFHCRAVTRLSNRRPSVGKHPGTISDWSGYPQRRISWMLTLTTRPRHLDLLRLVILLLCTEYQAVDNGLVFYCILLVWR